MCDKHSFHDLLSRSKGRCRVCGGICSVKKDLCPNCADAFVPLKYIEE
jgi:rubrerythrin